VKKDLIGRYINVYSPTGQNVGHSSLNLDLNPFRVEKPTSQILLMINPFRILDRGTGCEKEK